MTQTTVKEVSRLHMAAEELLKKVTELGGALTGEHGIGLTKAPFMALEHDGVSLEIMRGLKNYFDPNNILNPGKMGL